MSEEMNGPQLRLEVGGETGAYVVGEFSFTGKVQSFEQGLDRDAAVFVQISNADGELILASDGWVRSVEIESVPATESVPRYTKRKHKIRLGETTP